METNLVVLVLVGALLVLCLLARDASASVFGGLTAAYTIIGYYIPDSLGLLYYLCAALTDLLILVVLSKLSSGHVLKLRLQEVCVLFILLNWTGWVVWVLYLPPTIYIKAAIALYIYVILLILTLTIKRTKNVGDYTLDSWKSRILFNWAESLNVLLGIQKRGT